jgi:hypothetical protein
MKNIKSYISAVAIGAMVLSAVSCSKDFYTKANVNPNSPKAVTPATLLTGVEVSIGYTRGGDFSRFTSMFLQQSIGVSRQSAAYQNYVFTNQDPESAWDNIYDDVMENDYQLMVQASKAKDREYYGIGQIMMAYSLQLTVDCWGNAPYSQAFQGTSNKAPVYDVDKALYDTIWSLCYKGITNVNNSANDLAVPGGDDILYAGSASQWVKFANAILARVFIHQSYIKSTSTNVVPMADSAFAHANASFGSNADDAQVVFGSAATNNAPWYQFNTQRADIEFAYTNYTPGYYNTLSDSLIVEKDPRYSFMIDSLTEPISGDGLGAYYDGPGSASPLTGVVELSTYAEMQFVCAEALLRGATGGVAQTFYSSGINAHMTKLGVASGAVTAYMAGSWGVLSVIPANAILQNAWEENIALFTNPESWALWRRCQWNITPTAGSNGLPRRFLYPQSEINLNPNSLPQAKTATQWTPVVFWDK